MSNEDILDRIFLDCLMEIQKTYANIPKHLRLRTEKWCEKLASSGGSNRLWKKNRNDYAKLLLGMICSNRFSEPFQSIPPEGPLPSFPTHLKTKLKESLGPHESSFWRELYSSISQTEAPKSPTAALSAQPREPSESFAKFSNVISNHREIQSLALLSREQEQRIMLLEQQLRDERLSHELEIQRLIYAHRIELAKAAGKDLTSSFGGGERSPLGKSYIDIESTSKSNLSAVSQSFKFKDPEDSIDFEAGNKAPLGTFKASAYDPAPSYSARKTNTSANGVRTRAGNSEDNGYQIRTADEEDDDFLRYIEQFQQDIKQSVSSSTL